MTEQPFTIPTLGTLCVERVLIAYDGPRVFVCRSTTEAQYLCYWAAELARGDRWWFVPVSDTRLVQIEQRRITLRDAIVHSETGTVLQVEWEDGEDRPRLWQYLPAQEIAERELPSPDSYIPRATIRERADTLAPAFVTATQLQRPVVRLRVLTRGNEAPAKGVASLLSSIQGTLDAFGQVLTGRPSERGMIPQPLVDQTALSLSAVYAGSLGMELIGEELELLPDSLLSQAIGMLNTILAEGGDAEALERALHNNRHKRSVTRYKNLLEALVDVESDVEMTWGEPQGNHDERLVLRQVQIARSLETLYREELTTAKTEIIQGELVGINKRTKRFELRELGSDDKITGRILQSAMDAARRATLSKIYDATVVRTEEYQPITDEETRRYELLGLVEHGQPIESGGEGLPLE